MATNGLGHNRILKDEHVIKETMNYLKRFKANNLNSLNDADILKNNNFITQFD
jgi:hypothetical protein